MCGLGALVVLLWAPGSSFGAPSDSFHAGVESLIAEAGKTPDSARLHRLFQLHWDYLLHEFPEFATEVGAAGQNDRWTDRSSAAIARRKADLELPTRALATIDRTKLSPQDALNYDLFRRQAEAQLEGRRFPWELMPLTQLYGIHQGVPQVLSEQMPARTPAGYEAILRRLRDFIAIEYVPSCRESLAASALPDGQAWYAYLVAQSTTTRLTPKQIHEIGLAEVKQIRTEMEGIMRATGFAGDLAAFFEFLRTDPRFFFSRPEDLLAGYREIAKRADPEVIRLFGRMPRLPYGVVPMPAHNAASRSAGAYDAGSLAAGRPGSFSANLSAVDTRPKWEMEALVLHEAVPGHHLQIALAQEQPDLPNFRKYGGYEAYGEGWALYAETLGHEMGFYKDPYSHFGALNYQMWRAVRLVVDTGIHAFGWSRQQAIDYFKANSAKLEREIVVEIDRYIVSPGQALAYKIGQRKFHELRERATRELGARFDIRAFHDAVLAEGALPLDVLEARIDAWIAQRKASAASGER